MIDFEGEPARSLAERRRKRSPLRDVAGMLRSFAYAVSAVEILRGTAAPEGWESRARDEFIKGYHETVDPSLLPVGEAAFSRLLMVFELEKAVYELRYELNNRPGVGAHPGRRHPADARGDGEGMTTRVSARSTSTSSARAGTSSCTRSSARTSRDEGVAFAVWAPNAAKVSVVGEWNDWDGRVNAMEQRGVSGIWETVVADAPEGALYRYEITTREGHLLLKSDPYAFAAEAPPGNASRIFRSRYEWGDDEWIEQRRGRRAARRADVDLRGASRLVAAHARRTRRLDYRDLADAARRVREGPRLHARRAAAGHGAPVQRLVGLPGDRLLRADRAFRRTRTTSARSSTSCTGRGSA